MVYYQSMIEELRDFEFPQLGTGVFADFGGSFPMSQSQVARIDEWTSDISSQYPTLSGHSKVDLEIESFKHDLLALFHTNENEYSIFFGSNTSAVIEQLAHAFPWSQDGRFVYHADNHNSILGIREIAWRRKSAPAGVGSFQPNCGKSHSLFAYPPQSNFNGKKYPLEWVNDYQKIDEKIAHVLIDCAAFTPTCELDLSKYPAHFVAISLLKMFGYPGGALLVKNDVMPILENFNQLSYDKMALVVACAGFKVRKQFEVALQMSISQHVYQLAKELYIKISEMKHYNGKPIAEMYPKEFKDIDNQGGTISFNLFDSNGKPIAHEGIYTTAMSNSIFVRFGVHCNPGATYMELGWKPSSIKEATMKHEAACSLTASIINGKHVGSIRISFGYVSNQQDVDQLISFFENHYVEKEPTHVEPQESYKLAKAFIHPIKGCQGVEITTPTYRIVNTGFQYDEKWGIADELSTFLDRRRCPALATLKIEIVEKNMIITSKDGETITISIYDKPKGTKFSSSTACHEKINGEIYGPEVNQWFTDVLGQKAILVALNTSIMKPYRTFFTASLEAISIKQIEQLRPHIIFNSTIPFSEDEWVGSTRKLGDDLEFRVARKCKISTEAMISIEDGNEVTEPLKSICLLHEDKGEPVFGVELVANFKPSKTNKKQLVLDCELH